MRKRKLLLVVFAVLMIALLSISLAACKPVVPPVVIPPETVQDNLDDVKITGNTTTQTVTDTRALAYTAHVYDATEKVFTTVDFASLYTAIEYIVDNGDDTSYVTKKDGADKDVKLFTKKAAFAATSKDMFYYYENGVSLDTYTQWTSTYWQDGRNLNGASVVFLSGEGNGLQPYYQGHSLVGVNPARSTANNTAVWNVCQGISSSVMVNLDAYTGMTKVEYSINLKAAKIAPSMNADQKVYAYIGFTVADAYNVSNMGIVCDTTNGNWYYYSGEMGGSETDFTIDNRVVMTSTWNSTGKYFVPDEDIVISCQIVDIPDADDNTVTFPVDRLTVNFVDSDRTLVKDYEFPALTQCGTIRFNAYLDIAKPDGWTQPDFLNGAKLENLVVTKAEGTVLEEKTNPDNYGDMPAKLDAGVYNLLNSATLAATDYDARFHTVLYNSAFIDTNFTGGKDVYTISFNKATTTAPAYSSNITGLTAKINAIPALGSLVEADAVKVQDALAKLASLSTYQTQFVDPALITKLKAAQMECLTFIYDQATVDVIEIAIAFNGFKTYWIEALVAKDAELTALKTKYEALTADQKVDANDFMATQGKDYTHIEDLYKWYDAVKAATGNVKTVIDFTMHVERGPDAWTLDGRNSEAATVKNAYEALTEAEVALLPKLITDILESETKYIAYWKQWSTPIELKEKIAALDSSAATFEADLKAVVNLFNTLQAPTSFFFRTGSWLPAGFPNYKADWDVLQGFIDAHAGYEMDGGVIKVL